MEVILSDTETNENGSGDDSVPVHAVIVDASTFNFIDTQGVNTLLQVRSIKG